jgi:hypothetical protein
LTCVTPAAAPQVAEALGREPGSKDRGREALVHALGLAGNDGHTGLPWRELMQGAQGAAVHGWWSNGRSARVGLGRLTIP